MRRTIFTMTSVATLAAGYLMAGGFFLQLGNPEASPEARKANAVVTVKAVGCHDPALAKVTATAVGTMNGQKRSVPVELTKLSEPGMYAIAQQWPKEGKWVIQIVGHNDQQLTTTLLTAGPEGVDRMHAKSEMRVFSADEVESLLR